LLFSYRPSFFLLLPTDPVIDRVVLFWDHFSDPTAADSHNVRAGDIFRGGVSSPPLVLWISSVFASALFTYLVDFLEALVSYSVLCVVVERQQI